MKEHIENYFREVINVATTTHQTPEVIKLIEMSAIVMIDALKKGKKIIAVGNGGSSCDASHFTSELIGKYRDVREPLPAIALSDIAAMTCVSNDFGYQFVFSRQLRGLGNEGDVLLSLSTSGKSENVIKAMYTAREKGISIIGISGCNTTEEFVDACDVLIPIASELTNHIQEATISILHLLVELIEDELF